MMTSGTHDQRTVVLGAAVIAILAIGWFLLSWRVAHNPAGDAFSETLGVVFMLLIVGSLIGASLHRGSGDDEDNRGY
jgi:hypothetical protein